MSLFRRWRRQKKDLGTLGGNPSVADDVLAAGPPMDTRSGLPNIGFYDEEKSAAVEGDLLRDMSSDFDAEAESENKAWDQLGRPTDNE